MEDIEDNEVVIVFCSHCNLFQGARTKGFGRKYKNKSCILCKKKLSLENAIIPKNESIPSLIRKLNTPKDIEIESIIFK